MSTYRVHPHDIVVSRFSDIERLFNKQRRFRVTPQFAQYRKVRVLGNYAFVEKVSDEIYIVGTAYVGNEVPGDMSTPEKMHFTPDVHIFADSTLKFVDPLPNMNICKKFGLARRSSKTVKRRGTEWAYLDFDGPEGSFWASEPLHYDMLTHRPLNEDTRELVWDKDKQKEFNTWMRGLKEQFLVKARMDVLLGPLSAPHMYGPQKGTTFSKREYVSKMDDPMTVFTSLENHDLKALEQFTRRMGLSYWQSKGVVGGRIDVNIQVQQVNTIFEANRKRLQEQYGARQYK